MREAGYVTLCEAIGEEGFAGFQLFTHLVVGWPVYLLTNATGGRYDDVSNPNPDPNLDPGPYD